MAYDDVLLQARDQRAPEATVHEAPASQATQSASPARVDTNTMEAASTEPPSGFSGTVSKAVYRKAPFLSSLFGNDYAQADVNREVSARKDQRYADNFLRIHQGLQSQLSRSGRLDMLSDASIKAVYQSNELRDMAIIQTIAQMSPAIMREVADEKTWHLFDSNDRHPELDAAQKLLHEVGYRFGMDDKSNIYVESLDGQTQYLLDDNGIRNILDAAQGNLMKRIDLLASQDPKNSSFTMQGIAANRIQNALFDANGGDLNEAAGAAHKICMEAQGNPGFGRWSMCQAYDGLVKSYGSDLERILSLGEEGIPMLGDNGAMLVAQMQRELSRAGVEVRPDIDGRIVCNVRGKAYGVEDGTYGLKEFFDKLKENEASDENGFGSQLKREVARLKAKKATQELADAINRDALEQKQQLLNEQNAKSEAQRNAYLELAVEMGLVNEDSLASLSDEQKDALIAQVQMEQQQKQAKQDADYEQRKRALALQNMEADLQNKQNRGAGGTGKGKEDGTGNETAGETKVLTPEEKSMNLASKYGDNIYKLKPSAREQVFNLDSSIDKKAEKDGFTDKDGNPNIEAIYNPENFDKFSQFISQVKQIEAEIKERLDGVTAVPKNPYIKLYEAVSRDRGYALLHRDSVDNVGKVKEMRAQRRRLEEMYREVFDDKDPAGLVEIEDPARLSDNELVERLLAPKSTGLPMKVDIDMPKEGRGPFLSSPGKGPRPYFLALREEAEKYRAMMDDRQKRRNKIWRQAEKLGAKRPSRQEGKGK